MEFEDFEERTQMQSLKSHCLKIQTVSVLYWLFVKKTKQNRIFAQLKDFNPTHAEVRTRYPEHIFLAFYQKFKMFDEGEIRKRIVMSSS